MVLFENHDRNPSEKHQCAQDRSDREGPSENAENGSHRSLNGLIFRVAQVFDRTLGAFRPDRDAFGPAMMDE